MKAGWNNQADMCLWEKQSIKTRQREGGMGPAEFHVLATANEQAPHATLAYILRHDRRRLATSLFRELTSTTCNNSIYPAP